MEPLLYKDGLCKAAGIPFPCPYPTKVLLKPSSGSSAIRSLLNRITRTYPVIYAMGGADPAMGRACWRTRRARRAQCATALTLAILAALVAVGTLEAGWEPATTGAGAACDERAACEGQPATIYNRRSSTCRWRARPWRRARLPQRCRRWSQA